MSSTFCDNNSSTYQIFILTSDKSVEIVDSLSLLDAFKIFIEKTIHVTYIYYRIKKYDKYINR